MVALAAAALASAPAQAGWQRSPAAGQATTLPLRGVAMGSQTLVYAVGGTSAAPAIVRSADQFQTAAGTALVTGHGAAHALGAVWVAPGGATVHAFGLGGARASYSAATGLWTNAAAFAPGAQFDVAAVAFVDATLGYLLGGSGTAGALARWSPGFPADSVALPPGTGPLRAGWYSALDEGFLATAQELLRQRSGSTPTALWSSTTAGLTAASFEDQRGLAVGSGGLWIVDARPGAVRAPVGSFPLTQANAVALAPANFAVAVGAAGAIAESQDGGDTWRTLASPSTADLLAVSCFDENTCVATGSGGELLWYSNSAPTAVVKGALDVDEGSTVCLTATASDPDGDAVWLRWSDQGLGLLSATGAPFDGDTTSAPPCFEAPSVCADETFPLSLLVTDGRLVQSIDIALRVHDTIQRPPAIVAVDPPPPYDWFFGEVHTLVASATSECGRPVQFSYAATGAVPLPGTNGGAGERATFDLRSPASCAQGTTSSTITVIATDLAGLSSAPFALPVTVTSAPFMPSVELTFSNGFADGATIPEGTSTTVSVVAHHGCASPLDYAWSCTGETNPGDVPSKVFQPAANSCVPQLVTCDVEVSAPPSTNNPPAHASFSLRYGVRPNSLAVALTGGLTANGTTLPYNQTARATLVPEDPCNPDPNLTWATHWECTGIRSPQDGETYLDLTNSYRLCTPEVVDCRVSATPSDGSAPAQATFKVTRERGEVPVVRVDSRLGDCTTFGTPVLTLNESLTCSATVDYRCAPTDLSWSCGGHADSGPTHTFSNDGPVCDDTTTKCTLTVTPQDGALAQTRDVSVILAATPIETQLEVTWADGFENGGLIAHGGKATATVKAVSVCTAWIYDYQWACQNVVAPEPNPGATQFTFLHPGFRCAEDPAWCQVTARHANKNNPLLDSIATEPTLEVRYEPGPITTTLRANFSANFTGGFVNGGTLPQDGLVEVQLFVGNPCATDYKWVWSGDQCGDSCGERPQDRLLTCTHPGTCGDIAPFVCRVTAYPECPPPANPGDPQPDCGPAASTDVRINFDRARYPPAVALALSGGKVSGDSLYDGDAVEIAVTASQFCNVELLYRWSCEGTLPPAAGTTRWTLPHPSSVCAPTEVGCTVTVTPVDGSPSASQSFTLTMEPSAIDYGLALRYTGSHQSGDVLAPGDAVEVDASLESPCGWPVPLEWSCEGLEAPPPPTVGTSSAFIVNLGGLCEDRYVRCTVRAAPPYGFAPVEKSFEFWLQQDRQPAPQLAPVTAASYEPGASASLDCRDGGAPLRLVPHFAAGGAPSCPVQWSWRQLTALPLDLTVRDEDGALEVRATAGHDAALFGETARFEVAVSAANTPAAVERFEASFLPQRVVDLEHRPDRPTAAAGEEVGFTVALRNQCRSAFAPVDLQLALEGLAFVAGSARFDGAGLADPAALDSGSRTLTFRALSLPPGQPVELTYRARRSSLASGPAAATAVVVLSEHPEIAVSEPASSSTGASPVGSPEAASAPTVACQCQQAGGAAGMWAGVLLLALLPRRTRRR